MFNTWTLLDDDAPPAAPDYVHKGDRIRWQGTVWLGGFSVPKQQIQDALQAQGVYQIQISDDSSFLSGTVGFGSFTLTIDASWPIDMAHLSDARSVITGIVSSSGLAVEDAQAFFLQQGGTGLIPAPPTTAKPPSTSPQGGGGDLFDKLSANFGLSKTVVTTGAIVIGSLIAIALLKR